MKSTYRLAGVVLAAAAGLAACGSDSASPAASSTGAAAATSSAAGTTAASATASATATATATDTASASGSTGASSEAAGAASGQEVAQKIEAAGKALKTVHMESAGETKGQKTLTVSDVDFEKKAMDIKITAGSAVISERLVADAIYLKAPGMPGGDKWHKLSEAELAKVGMASPSAIIDQARGMSTAASVKTVDDKGTEAVGGEQLHKYVMTVGTDQIKALMQKQLASLPADAAKKALAAIPPTMEQTVWVDDQYRMHKSAATLPTGTTTSTYSKFDAPLDIMAPTGAELGG